MKESEIRKKLKKSREKILENSRKMNEEIDRIKLEEVTGVANEIKNLFPDGIPEEIFQRIVTVIAKYRKKHEDAIQKFLEMNRQKQIIELENTKIDDEDWWAKASAAKSLGIEIPGMEMENVLERSRRKAKKRDQQ